MMILTKKLINMVKTKPKWRFLLFGLLTLANHAQAQKPYSLDDCLQMALQSNLQLKVAEADIKNSDQVVAETRAALLPQISGEYNFAYNSDLPPVFLPGFIAGQPEVENVPAILGLKQTQFAGVQASQQVFNPQLFAALKTVKKAKQLSEQQSQQTREEIAYSVSATYYNLLSLYKSMDLLQANIESFETTISTTETLQRNDFVKKSDVSRLVLAKKSLETQLLSLKVTETTLLNALRLLTNAPDNMPFNINSEIGSEVSSISITDTTANNRSDFKILQKSIELKEIERKGVLASYMPTLVLFGGYYSYAYNADFNPTERAENKSFPVSQIGLSLKLPISDGGERHAKARQKTIESVQLNYQKQLLQQQAENEIINAIEKYNANLEIMKKEEESIVLAQTTLDETKTNYRNGFADITDIINSENDLLKTQTAYITALVNVRIAVLEWKKANGTLLSF